MAMQSPTERHDLEALLGHTRWLRDLARRLVADGGAADDLVQEAYVVALERPRPTGATRSWLAGIVRNLARRRGRGEARRGRREARAAERRRPQLDTDEALAQAELQRRLIELVFRLPEAERTTLVLHFFEGLGAVDIAARLDLSASTVRSRLARALSRLRTLLDRELGNEPGAWCALLLPLAERAGPLPAATVSTAGEIAAVGIKMKVAGAVAGLGAALATVLWVLPGEGESESVGTAGSGVDPQIGSAAPVDGPGERPLEGRAVEPAAVPETPPDEILAADAGGVLVYGALVGADGSRVEGGQVEFLDSMGRNRSGEVGAPGTYSILDLESGPWEVLALCDGYAMARSTLEVPHGVDVLRHDIELIPLASIPVRFENLAGEVFAMQSASPFTRPVAVATADRPGANLPGVRGRNAAWYGVGHYEAPSLPGERIRGLDPRYDGRLHLRREPPLWVSAVLRGAVLESRAVTGPVDELVFRIDPARAEGLLATVRLRVVDGATGEPLADSRVSLTHASTSGGSSPTDGDGRVVLRRQLTGSLLLQVRAAGYGPHQRWLELSAGDDLDLGEVSLGAPATLRGRLVDPDGQPAEGMLYIHPLDGAARDDGPMAAESTLVYHVGPEREFELDVAQGRYLVRVSGSRWAHAAHVVEAGGPPVELMTQVGVEIGIRAEGATLGSRYTIVTSDGTPVFTETLRGPIARTPRLAPGRYELWQGWERDVTLRTPFEVGAEPIGLELLPLEAPR